MVLNYNREDLLYLAGIIDGEGHFCKPKRRNGRGDTYYEHRIVISNNSKELMDWITDRFGGYVYAPRIRKLTHNQSYQWILSGVKAVTLASWLQPHLVVKRIQVMRLLG